MDEALAFVESQAHLATHQTRPSPTNPHDTTPLSSAKERTHVGPLPIHTAAADEQNQYYDPVDRVWINIKDPNVPFVVKKRAMAFGQKADSSSDAAAKMLRDRNNRR